MICKIHRKVLLLQKLKYNKMKKSPLQRIEELIPVLPGRDFELAKKFLKERNFESILELVESDLYKSMAHEDNTPDEYVSNLTELKGELTTYMSYLDVPDNSDEYDDY